MEPHDVGQRVRHSVHGLGTVRDLRGACSLVEFDYAPHAAIRSRKKLVERCDLTVVEAEERRLDEAWIDDLRRRGMDVE